MSEARKCAACGAVAREEARFCEACGAELPVQEAPRPEAEPAPDVAARFAALQEHPDLPALTTVLVTHAHWDHIGGHTYLRSLSPSPVFYGRANYASTLDRSLRRHRYAQFRSRHYQDAWLEPIPAGSEVHLMPKIAGG